VSPCDTTKEVWDILVTIYKGTSQVCEIHLQVRTVTKIINDLKSLAKNIHQWRDDKNGLAMLPRCEWEPKVLTIEEAQGLKTLNLDDLVGNLLTYKSHL